MEILEKYILRLLLNVWKIWKLNQTNVETLQSKKGQVMVLMMGSVAVGRKQILKSTYYVPLMNTHSHPLKRNYFPLL